ncbi:MAG: hypothetical protein ACKOT0_05610 [bacterium]
MARRFLVALSAAALAAVSLTAGCTSEGSAEGAGTAPSVPTALPSDFLPETPAPTGQADAPVLVPMDELLVTVTIGGIAEFEVPEGEETDWTIRSSDTTIVEVVPGADGQYPSARGVAEGTTDVFMVNPEGEQVGYIVTVVP